MALRQVTTDYSAIAIEQGVGETVDVSMKRPRAGGGVHRTIVAAGGSREQYDRLRASAPKTTSAIGLAAPPAGPSTLSD